MKGKKFWCNKSSSKVLIQYFDAGLNTCFCDRYQLDMVLSEIRGLRAFVTNLVMSRLRAFYCVDFTQNFGRNSDFTLGTI